MHLHKQITSLIRTHQLNSSIVILFHLRQNSLSRVFFNLSCLFNNFWKRERESVCVFSILNFACVSCLCQVDLILNTTFASYRKRKFVFHFYTKSNQVLLHFVCTLRIVMLLLKLAEHYLSTLKYWVSISIGRSVLFKERDGEGGGEILCWQLFFRALPTRSPANLTGRKLIVNN